MLSPPKISVIIPAYNEEEAVGLVVRDLPDQVDQVIVVDNGSSDQTTSVAREAGATVVVEDRKGYGWACLAGIDRLQKEEPPEIVVFLDGDYSDYPAELNHLIAPILKNEADLVIGTRLKEWRERGSMTLPQEFGNWLATRLMRWLYGAHYTDLGPFRAIRYRSLLELNMQDKTYGWTVEMQLKALRQSLRYVEVPVHYRNRIGASKVSGTLKGAFMAGVKILWWISKYSLR